MLVIGEIMIKIYEIKNVKYYSVVLKLWQEITKQFIF